MDADQIEILSCSEGRLISKNWQNSSRLSLYPVRRPRPQRLLNFSSVRLARHRKVILRLQVEPGFRIGAKIPSQPARRVGRDWSVAHIAGR
jgi:hypothetical protein